MRFWKRTTSPPPDETRENGAKYYSIVSWDGSQPNEVLDDSDVLRWRCELSPPRPPLSLLNLYRKPEYQVLTPKGHKLLTIRRIKRLPATFEMSDGDAIVGTIQLRSILRNKFKVCLSNGDEWTIRMPLFTVYFWAESTAGSRVWILVGPSVMRWNILVEPGIDNAHLVPALTFVQREWCVYS